MPNPDQLQKQINQLAKKQEEQGEKIATLEGKRVDASASLPPKEKWWKRNSVLLSLLVAVVGLAFGPGLVSKIFVFTFDSRIDTKLATPLNDLHQLQVDVGKISTKLDTFISEEHVRRLSELKPSQLKKNLPEAAETLKTATALGVSVSPEVKNSIQENLASISDRGPNFWPAAAAMINYQSTAASPGEMPACDLVGHAPAMLAESMNAAQTTAKFKLNPYENCQIVLDSPEAQRLYLKTLGVFDIEFKKCKIIYRGGPLLFPAHVVPGRKTMSLIFVDCTFEILTNGVPHGDGKSLVATLLSAKNLEDVSIKLPTSGG